MKYLLVMLLLIPFTARADSDFFSQDLIACIEKDCHSNQLIYDFEPESKVKLQFGFNIVHWGGTRGTKFYPLFQVYNHNKSAIDILIGIQLLDQNKSLLLEIAQNNIFKPTTKTKPSYETYLSVNAKSITKEIMNRTKFMRVVYKRNSN